MTSKNSDLEDFLKPRRSKRKIPMTHLAHIGMAIDEWNQLEFLLDRAIWKLVQAQQPIVACLTSQYSGIFPRMSALISLVELLKLSKEACKKLRALNGGMGRLSSLRNRIVHDPRFLRDGQDVVRFEIVAKAELSFGSKVETPETLNEFILAIKSLRSWFLEIWVIISRVISVNPNILLVELNQIKFNDLDAQDPLVDPLKAHSGKKASKDLSL